ncbi:MFS transporter [Paenibacillus sp. MSJ-34]|uniref:MFS transporter n=1 Tax=Paenibacillus sp. MSJ-34 TaxID=2841529 RepID=UPI00209E7AA1
MQVLTSYRSDYRIAYPHTNYPESRDRMKTATMLRHNRHLFSPFVIELLIIMFLVEFVKGALLVAILPVYMGTVLGLSAFSIGWAFALQYIGDNAFRSPIGWVVERIGYRASMIAGLALTLLAVAIIAYTSSVGWIVVACALLGVGTAPLWPCVVTGATQMAGEKKQGTVLSIVNAAWLSGTGAGPVIINFVMKDSFAPAFRVLFVCMTAIIVIALFLPGQRQTEAMHDRQKDGGSADARLAPRGLWRNIVGSYRQIGRTLHVSRWFYPALFLQTFAVGLLSPVITLYARTVLHLSPSQFSMLLVAGGGITLLGLIPAGKLVDKFGSAWFLHIGFALSTAAIVTLTWTRSLPAVYSVVGMIGLSYALILPAWNAWVGSIVPKEERGATWGFFLTINGSGMVLGPIISGKLWDLFGPQAPFWVSAATQAVLFVLHLFITAKERIVVR